jgi:hypothetical protein
MPYLLLVAAGYSVRKPANKDYSCMGFERDRTALKTYRALTFGRVDCVLGALQHCLDLLDDVAN